MQQLLAELQETFQGKVILPGDDDYPLLSKTLNNTGAPAVILQPSTTAAVKQAIAFAEQARLTISVRSGGHHWAGFGTNNGGVVVDMSAFNTVEILDQAKGLVRIGSGALWGTVATALQKHGLGISSGDTATVGVGGLTLGGGIGWMVRQYGLTIDQLVAAEVVTANGAIVRASQHENPELFWALRGGGGNFGIVTAFEFTAHPVDRVYAGSFAFKLENLTDLLKHWRDAMRQAPDTLTSMFMAVSMPGQEPSAVVLFCFNGSRRSGEQATAALKQIGTLSNQEVSYEPYAKLLEDARPPQPDMQIHMHNAFFKDLSDELIETIGNQPSMFIQIRYLGGRVAHIAPDATAFAYRDSEVAVILPVFIPTNTPESALREAEQIRQKIEALGQGAYSNFLSENTTEIVQRIYPPATYERLAQVKKQYDPDNRFTQNYNILPA